MTGNFDDAIQTIRETHTNLVARNKYLQNELAKVKNEKYKDEELARMSKALESAQAELRRGFRVTEAEAEEIDAWVRNHEKISHDNALGSGCICTQSSIGGKYSYIFTPTSVGIIGKVQCTCGAEHVFRDLL